MSGHSRRNTTIGSNKKVKGIGGTADSGDRGDGPLHAQAGGNQAAQNALSPVGPYSPAYLAALGGDSTLGPVKPARAPGLNPYGAMFGEPGMYGVNEPTNFMSEYDYTGLEGIGAMVAAASAAAAAAATEAQWGEAQVTKMEDVYDIEGNLKIEIPKDAVLYIGYGPEDKEFLDLEAESAALGEKANVVTIFNPTDEVLQSLLKDGQAETVVVGGHGSEGNVITVDEDGKSRERTGKEFASLFKGTGVQEVFMNICESAKGANSVVSEMKNLGMAVLGWTGNVADKSAIKAADTLVEMTNMIVDGASVEELAKVADTFDGPGGNLIMEVLDKAGTDPAAIKAMLAEMEFDFSGLGGYNFGGYM